MKKQGKALAIDHNLFDELWKIGPQKLPTNVVIEAETIEESALPTEEVKEAPKEEEKEFTLSEADWDKRVLEAFKRTCVECVEPEDLPMEPSDFQKLLLEFTIEGKNKLEIKKSSYKKLGKLLDMMSTGKNGQGFIDYFESKQKGHKIITKIYTSKISDGFVPECRLKRVRGGVLKAVEESKEEQSVTYPQILIDEVFTLGKHI
mmetsp:Transcript_29476/g.44729  ORF Transcript_29476/g.44729 Transcript_29476/m.44729 type:complete len:204 (+) Transcript_29476:853-1464(+)